MSHIEPHQPLPALLPLLFRDAALLIRALPLTFRLRLPGPRDLPLRLRPPALLLGRGGCQPSPRCLVIGTTLFLVGPGSLFMCDPDRFL
jgi:hypothetical protein